eukprot:s4818_g2.t1
MESKNAGGMGARPNLARSVTKQVASESLLFAAHWFGARRFDKPKERKKDLAARSGTVSMPNSPPTAVPPTLTRGFTSRMVPESLREEVMLNFLKKHKPPARSGTFSQTLMRGFTRSASQPPSMDQGGSSTTLGAMPKGGSSFSLGGGDAPTTRVQDVIVEGDEEDDDWETLRSTSKVLPSNISRPSQRNDDTGLDGMLHATVSGSLAVEQLLWQFKPIFTISQLVLAFGAWALLPLFNPDSANDARSGSAGLESLWPGDTAFLLQRDCTDLRYQLVGRLVGWLVGCAERFPLERDGVNEQTRIDRAAAGLRAKGGDGALLDAAGGWEEFIHSHAVLLIYIYILYCCGFRGHDHHGRCHGTLESIHPESTAAVFLRDRVRPIMEKLVRMRKKVGPCLIPLMLFAVLLLLLGLCAALWALLRAVFKGREVSISMFNAKEDNRPAPAPRSTGPGGGGGGGKSRGKGRKRVPGDDRGMGRSFDRGPPSRAEFGSERPRLELKPRSKPMPGDANYREELIRQRLRGLGQLLQLGQAVFRIHLHMTSATTMTVPKLGNVSDDSPPRGAAFGSARPVNDRYKTTRADADDNWRR